MNETDRANSAAAGWVSYRPEIKVLDCTIRDGGLMNDHKFDDGLVRAVYEACVAAGVDYMELGYKNSKSLFSPDENGAWKFCDEEAMRRIVGDNDSDLKLAAMADAEKSDFREDIQSASDSVLDMIRVASYIHQIPLALEMIQDAHDKGYETTLNLMAISTVSERELEEALSLLARSAVQTIYVVDSFGALYGEQVVSFVEKFRQYTENSEKTVGIHAHNNQQLGFANTIDALIHGANMLDASFAGLGRGAGNCAMELLVGFLHNPKLRLRPILECVQSHIEPMRSQLLWGYDLPYMVTGLLNQHPRSGMAFNKSPDKGDFVKFYDLALAEED